MSAQLPASSTRRGARLFRQADVKRAVRAVEAAGLEVGQVEIVAATGNIVIKARSEVANQNGRGGDLDLDQELAAFEARHGHG